ncbi:uncharacterized protein G2W53_016981 [Senna tora]|uniref:Uncharacterized protein n=1 Tax=Senna tora TaxID=362788 RepID=A0A834WK17_9FABA|nr:uncharacterized protein G2W53_016981 [Senna tora]
MDRSIRSLVGSPWANSKIDWAGLGPLYENDPKILVQLSP